MADIPKNKIIYIKTSSKWRRWLMKNSMKKKEIWLVYYKKHTNKSSIPYNDAVEEAICFGWIDGKVRRIDDEKYMQRYTPRNPRSLWSESNINRAKKMIKQNKMTKKGLKLYKDAMKKKQIAPSTSKQLRTPPDMIKEIRKNKTALGNYKKFPKSSKLIYLHWVKDAKRKETRERRIKKVVKRIEQNKKPGVM